FRAVTTKWYVVPLLRPLSRNGLRAPVIRLPPGSVSKFDGVTPDTVATYTLYDVAPLTSSQLRVTCPSPGTALTPVGDGSSGTSVAVGTGVRVFVGVAVRGRVDVGVGLGAVEGAQRDSANAFAAF